MQLWLAQQLLFWGVQNLFAGKPMPAYPAACQSRLVVLW
jgi:hypothetical protein